MNNLAQALRSIWPDQVRRMLRTRRSRRKLKAYENLTLEQVFTRIYEQKAWVKSKDPSFKYSSGRGSHDESVVAPYVDSVRSFIDALGSKPTVVDLGCGDFNVGSRIRSSCGDYIACDIVRPVIEWNRERWRDLNVDFRVLDITKDNPPPGDVVFIRQVLQHLSNADIAAAIPKLAQYKYVVLTETLPEAPFTCNVDKPTGPDTRLRIGSGIDLAKPPFELAFKSRTAICKVPQYGGTILTEVFTLA